MAVHVTTQELAGVPRAVYGAVRLEVISQPRALKIWLAFLTGLCLLGAAAALIALPPGWEVFVTSPSFEWGILITGYVFFAVTTSGLCVASSLGTVFGIERFMPFEKRHAILALLCLVTAFGIIALDLHFPVRMESAQAGFSAFEKLPATFEEFMLAQTAAEVAQANELGIWKSNLWYDSALVPGQDGMVGYLIDNSAIVRPFSGATSGSNVVARLQEALDYSPAALYGKEVTNTMLSPATKKAYQAALSAGNYNFQFYVGEKPMNFQGIPVTMCPGLNDYDCVLGMKSDLHFGTGLLSDYNEVKVIDMSDIDGSQNVRVIMRFTGGIIATNPTQQVVINVT